MTQSGALLCLLTVAIAHWPRLAGGVGEGPPSQAVVDVVTGAAAASPSHNNPTLFVDGAFRHRPFSSGRYGFKLAAKAVAIPENAGDPPGRMTWVDIALCCASTPQASSSPELDRPRPDAAAPAPAERCLTYQELTADPPKTYRNDVEPRGLPKSPCRDRNPAYFRDAHNMYQPRHESCCEYMDEFTQAAWEEFEDAASQRVLRTLAAASGASLFRRAHLFVLAHDVWKTRVCRNEHGKPTGACCSDCRRGDRYQLPRYAGGRGGGASQAHGACSYFAEGWCPREEGGEWDLLASDNAALLADGAFNHRPTVDAPARMEAAGFAPGGARYVIHGSRGPAFELVDHNGDRSGQQSWVDVARCCAMAPANSTEPGRDLPDTRAFAGPPLGQCLPEAQLRRLRASGRNVSPCRAQNAAFFRADDGQWRARHPACCAYLREFLRRAPSEFTDNRSQRLLAVVARQPTLFVQARKLVALFNRFTREVCRADATPSGRCCADCLTAHRNKKTAFADPTSCGGHGGRGAPRRAYCTPAQLAAANRSAHAQRAAHAATASHVAATTAASGFDRGGSGDVGGGGLTAERAQAQVTPGADSPSPQLNSLAQALRQWQGSRREPEPAFVASLAAALRQLAAEAPQGRSQPPPSAAAGSLDAVSEAELLVHGMVGTAGGAGGAGSSNVDPAGMPPRRQQQRQQALEPQRVPSPPPSQPESERGIPAWAEGLGPDERQRLEALRAEQDLIAQELTDISRHHADRKARGGG